jgi:hypothetical protein
MRVNGMQEFVIARLTVGTNENRLNGRNRDRRLTAASRIVAEGPSATLERAVVPLGLRA